MAVSKVKLPDNSVHDIHDARITGVDSTPTSGSTNVITSGAVYSNAVTAVGLSGDNVAITKSGDTNIITIPYATKAAQDGSGNVIVETYYPKTTYEWNKALSCGSNGKICIGKFQMYDSNVTIHLSITTNITYNATIVIQSQNLNRATSYGSIRCDVYGDFQNSITPLISVFRPNPNTANGAVEVYANLPGWSKNILHIQALGLEADATDIVTSVSEVPSSVAGKTALVHDNTGSANEKICNLFTSHILTVDDSISGTSTNPVSNSAIDAEFAKVSYIGDTLETVDPIDDEPEPEPVIVIGGGDENVIEAITFNGSAVPINASTKTAAITASIPTESTVSGWGFTKNSGTVTKVKVGTSEYNPSSGVVSLPAYPTTLPASDVSAWAKASTKPTYTASEVGALPSTTSIPTESTVSGWGFTKNAGTLTGVTFNGANASVSNGVAAITATIPSAVTESTVSGWGFTKNSGTITGITMNGSSKGTSGTVNLGTVVTAETDPVFTASAAHGISSTDISNWNAKQKAITVSSSEPTSSQGSNGDIWIVI